MSVIFAAIVPHNPIFLPAVGRENTILAQASLDAINKIQNLITAKNIDTLIFFSAHSPRLDNSFGINQCAKYIGKFQQFGDLVTTVKSRGDIELSHSIKAYLESNTAIQTFCQIEIDYGISVPLSLLQTDTKPFKIIPISISNNDRKTHLLTGQKILKPVDISPKRIGVIASMHLSHSNDSEITNQKKCDDMILKAIKNSDINALENIPIEILKDAEIYGIESLFMLFGMINSKKYSTDILAFQNILGTSPLTATFTW